jgi:hypothetical protein
MAGEIEVEGPDGAIFAFPAGTAEGVMRTALMKHYAQPAPSTSRAEGKAEGKKEGFIGSLGTAIQTGLTGNLPDFIPAAISGAKGALTGEGFSSPYERTLEYHRGYREGIGEERPWTMLGGQVAGAVAPGVAAAKLITAPTLLGRAAQSTAIGGILGGGQGLASGEGLQDRLEQGGKGAAYGSAFGFLGEGVATGARKLASKMFGAADTAAPGVVPPQRIAAAEEFGIPLTRGQATGNLQQQAWEEAARNNARGAPAGAVLGRFDADQAAAIKAAQDRIAQGFGGTAPPIEAADTTIAALRNRAFKLESDANRAYGSAAQKSASVPAEDVARLSQSVRDSLEQGGIILDAPGAYVGAHNAMNILRRVSGFEGAPTGAKVTAESLEGIEQARKALNKVKGAHPEDWRALTAIRNSFDDWLADVADRGAIIGDKTALDDLRKGRASWSQYKSLTSPRPGNDAATGIAKLVSSKQEATPEEAARLLLGTGADASKSGRAVENIAETFGKSSPEFEGLRQAAWQKVITPRENAGPQAIASSISDFLGGKGAPLARQLYSDAERAQMRRYAETLRNLVTDPKATNRGQSGYEWARLMGGKADLLAGLGGLGTAYSTGDPRYLALAGLPVLKNVSSAAKAGAATRAAPYDLEMLGLLGRGATFAPAGLLSGR